MPTTPSPLDSLLDECPAGYAPPAGHGWLPLVVLLAGIALSALASFRVTELVEAQASLHPPALSPSPATATSDDDALLQGIAPAASHKAAPRPKDSLSARVFAIGSLLSALVAGLLLFSHRQRQQAERRALATAAWANARRCCNPRWPRSRNGFSCWTAATS